MASLENTVVVGVDGSAASTGAVAYAANTAATRRIPLLLVTSYTMPAAMFAEGMIPPQPVYDELERECTPIIEKARETAAKVAPGIEVSYSLSSRRGKPLMPPACRSVCMRSRRPVRILCG